MTQEQKPYEPNKSPGEEVYKGPKKLDGVDDLLDGIDELVNKDKLAQNYRQSGGQ